MTTTDKINALLASVTTPKNVFRRYAHAQNTATKLTTNKTLQAAMVLFLMASNEEERRIINRDFEQTIQELSETEKIEFKEAFTQSFKNLLPLSDDLLRRINAVQVHKKAA
jgi:deoxyadenosine/deoxycytidine kinase